MIYNWTLELDVDHQLYFRYIHILQYACANHFYYSYGIYK